MIRGATFVVEMTPKRRIGVEPDRSAGGIRYAIYSRQTHRPSNPGLAGANDGVLKALKNSARNSSALASRWPEGDLLDD